MGRKSECITLSAARFTISMISINIEPPLVATACSLSHGPPLVCGLHHTWIILVARNIVKRTRLVLHAAFRLTNYVTWNQNRWIMSIDKLWFLKDILRNRNRRIFTFRRTGRSFIENWWYSTINTILRPIIIVAII